MDNHDTDFQGEPGGALPSLSAMNASFKRAAIVDRVRGVLVRVSGRSQETMPEDMRLHEDLELDSAERIETAQELEEEFGISLSDDEVDLACMSTVGGIADYLIAQRGVE